MAIFATANTKGGSGKSTIAVNLAGEFALNDAEVLIIDTDISENVWKWAEIPESTKPKNITVIRERDVQEITNILDNENDTYPIIIVDLAGYDSAIIDPVFRRTDCIISPVQASRPDLIGLQNIITMKEQLDETIPHFVALTMQRALISHNSAMAKGAMQLCENSTATMLNTTLAMRICYQDAMSFGDTIQTTTTRNKKTGKPEVTKAIQAGRTEFANFANEILDQLNSTRQENHNG